MIFIWKSFVLVCSHNTHSLAIWQHTCRHEVMIKQYNKCISTLLTCFNRLLWAQGKECVSFVYWSNSTNFFCMTKIYVALLIHNVTFAWLLNQSEPKHVCLHCTVKPAQQAKYTVNMLIVKASNILTKSVHDFIFHHNYKNVTRHTNTHPHTHTHRENIITSNAIARQGCLPVTGYTSCITRKQRRLRYIASALA